MNDYSKAFSLVELIIFIAILSISIMLATPALSDFTTKNRITTKVNTLARAIRMARETAVTMNKVVTLCRSADQQTCTGQWHEGMILFIDKNGDHLFNESDHFIAKYEAFPKGDEIFWRAFRNKQYLQMSPIGFTRFQNGTFTYCPKEGLEYARGIIVNAQGRLRFTSDKDGDGIDEGANGQPLRCG